MFAILAATADPMTPITISNLEASDKITKVMPETRAVMQNAIAEIPVTFESAMLRQIKTQPNICAASTKDVSFALLMKYFQWSRKQRV